MRTAAVSALALRHAAPRPVRHAALLGAGTQATMHLAMLAACFPDLEQVAVWNRTPAARDGMLEQAGRLPWPVIRADPLSDALAGADAVLACTAATQPILQAEAALPGRIVLQIGYHEASFELIDASTAVVVDLWGEFRSTSAKSLFQAHRAGRFEAGRLAAELADVLAGHWTPRPDDVVYFSSFGLNIFDLALATRVLRRAAELGHGRMLDLAGEEKPR
jgi:ornithine cyclodeaminase